MNGASTAKILLLALFGITAYLLYWVFQPFLSAIAWAIFLTTAFYPMHARIVRVVRGRLTIAAILSTSLVASVIVLPLGFIVIMLTRSVGDILAEMQLTEMTARAAAGPEAGHAAAQEDVPPIGNGRALEATANTNPTTNNAAASGATAPAAGSSAQPSRSGGASHPLPTPAPPARRLPVIADIEHFLSRYMDVAALDIQGTAFSALQRLGQTLAVMASSLVQNILWTLVMFAIMIFAMVSLFREGPAIVQAFKRTLPLSEADREAMVSRLHEMTRGVFYGVFMTSAVQGILGGLGWWVLGLSSALTAGVAMFFCSLLPTGTVIVWGPGAAYLLIQGHPFKALLLMLWGLAIVGTIDNFLRPYFISGRTQMHSLLVFFGVLGGLAAYGIGGLFLGPLLITLFLFLLEVIQRDMFREGSGQDASGLTS